jgi:DNA primase
MIDREATRLRCERVRERITLSALIGRHVALKRSGSWMKGLCPFHDEKTPSFGVRDSHGIFHCFGCGARGDAISFAMLLGKLKFIEALEALEREHGIEAAPPTPEEKRRLEAAAAARARAQAEEAAGRLAAAEGIWRSTQSVYAGTPVDRYLRGRALVPPRDYGVGGPVGPAGWPVDLRWMPALRNRTLQHVGPAMVAAIRAPDGSVLAVHRTWLEPDGRGGWRKLTIPDEAPPEASAKLTLGTFLFDRAEEDGGPWCGAIRLGPADSHMCFGEGIETTLSGMQLARCSGWCGVSSGALPSLEPPFVCGEALYLVDRDRKGTGEAACNRAAWRWRHGRTCSLQIPPAEDGVKDWNDALRRMPAAAPQLQGEDA